MAKRSPSPSGRTPIQARPTLTDRVKDRVARAGIALDRGTKPHLDEEREARSLRRVYGELRVTYQRYRRQTGRSAVPELRDAVQAFKRGPSLTSLVGVAVFLDDRSLLTW